METMIIWDAIALAGNGGVVRRAGADYTVKELVEEGNPPKYFLNEYPVAMFQEDGWQVIKKAETVSAATFFDNLAIGRVVSYLGNSKKYVYTGRSARDGVHQVALVSIREPLVVWLTLDELTKENSWVSMDYSVEDPAPYVAIVSLTKGNEHRDRELERVNDELRDLRTDFKVLNNALNEYADDEGMCSGYEDTLDEWNSLFRRVKLIGRERDWEVAVTINDSHTLYYSPVKAASAEEAAKIVDDMSTREIVERLCDMGDLHIEVDENETRRA